MPERHRHRRDRPRLPRRAVRVGALGRQALADPADRHLELVPTDTVAAITGLGVTNTLVLGSDKVVVGDRRRRRCRRRRVSPGRPATTPSRPVADLAETKAADVQLRRARRRHLVPGRARRRRARGARVGDDAAHAAATASRSRRVPAAAPPHGDDAPAGVRLDGRAARGDVPSGRGRAALDARSHRRTTRTAPSRGRRSCVLRLARRLAGALRPAVSVVVRSRWPSSGATGPVERARAGSLPEWPCSSTSAEHRNRVPVELEEAGEALDGVEIVVPV